MLSLHKAFHQGPWKISLQNKAIPPSVSIVNYVMLSHNWPQMSAHNWVRECMGVNSILWFCIPVTNAHTLTPNDFQRKMDASGFTAVQKEEVVMRSALIISMLAANAL